MPNIEEVFVPVFSGVSSKPDSLVTGSRSFEQLYAARQISMGYRSPVVWRGTMEPVKSAIEFIDAYKPKGSNQYEMIQGELFFSHEIGGGVHFFLIYQMLRNMPGTIMTFILSREEEIVKNRAIQTAKYGTYIPKMYRASLDADLPVIEGYEGLGPTLTVLKILDAFPFLIEFIPVAINDLFVTNRLASYLYDHTDQIGPVDGEDLIAKVSLQPHIKNNKYLTEITQIDGQSGILSLNGMRLWETNDPAQGVLKKWKGPLSTKKLVSLDK